MKLLTPRTYRVKQEQDAFLQEKAKQEGHGNKALTLRLILDREMSKCRRNISRKHLRRTA